MDWTRWTKNIAPKDDGLSVMKSAFQSREFGFGVVVSKDHLKEVNEKRRNTKYKDLKAAIESRGCKMASKSHLPLHLSLEPLSMELIVMAIGTTTTWLCSWKTV
jgi:hypothetical protein